MVFRVNLMFVFKARFAFFTTVVLCCSTKAQADYSLENHQLRTKLMTSAFAHAILFKTIPFEDLGANPLLFAV